jgi:hypothetical protein
VSGLQARVETVRRSARLERAKASAPRVLLAAALTITSAIGVRGLIAPGGEPEALPARGAPDHALEDFAQGFARAYLSYDPHRSAVRDRALGAYVPDDLDSGAGLAPGGTEDREVAWTRVAQNQEALAGGRIVVVAAGFKDQTDDPLYLAVPVRRLAGGELALSGYPALVGAPTRTSAPLPARESVEDPEILALAERVVRNYLAGERADLAADLAPGAAVAIPAQSLSVVSLDEVVWASGPESGAVLATVIARDETGSEWTLTYELGLERRRGRVLTSFIETLANEP